MNLIHYKHLKDVVKPKDLMKMLGLGKNKIFELLKKQEIYNKKVGSKYIIPKKSVIEYLINK